MISREQNELMTRIGPGTPAGKLLRRYWQPVALVDEMQGERPVKAVRLFSENLVLYKANNGYALMQRHCPHRGADHHEERPRPEAQSPPGRAGSGRTDVLALRMIVSEAAFGSPRPLTRTTNGSRCEPFKSWISV